MANIDHFIFFYNFIIFDNFIRINIIKVIIFDKFQSMRKFLNFKTIRKKVTFLSELFF